MGLQMLMELKNAKFWKQKILQGINAYKKNLTSNFTNLWLYGEFNIQCTGKKEKKLTFFVSFLCFLAVL